MKSDNFERQIKIILSNLNIEISESEKMSFYEVSDFTKENTFTDLAEGPAVDKVNSSKIAILNQKLTISMYTIYMMAIFFGTGHLKLHLRRLSPGTSRGRPIRQP